MTLLAAAAMIALAVTIYISVRPRSQGPIANNNDRIASDPGNRRGRFNQRASRTFVAETTVRLVAFTQPLEQEAQALKSDLKRAADRLRNALPRPARGSAQN